MTKWPRNEPAELLDFFGPVGTSQVSLVLPYPMILAWDPSRQVSKIPCHLKVRDSLGRILAQVLQTYGSEDVHRLRLNRFGGCLNVRKMRGGTRMSVHSWGVAIDLDPENNPLRMNHKQAIFAQEDYRTFWEIVEKEGWTSLGRARDYDWMHFQATSTA